MKSILYAKQNKMVGIISYKWEFILQKGEIIKRVKVVKNKSFMRIINKYLNS